MKNLINQLITDLEELPQEELIKQINSIKVMLHDISPFKNEPVDCVLWVKGELVNANDYNPNSVAPPEMELLRVSISEDGYTQPIVAWKEEDKFEVVDGFHRNRVGKESEEIKNRIFSYLPVVEIRNTQKDKNDRMASTIRHNRARGKHRVESMSSIVIELKKRNWSTEKISKNLGMDSDEVLRLCQVSGLAEVFSNTDFSEAWEAEIYKDEDFSILTEEDVKQEKIKKQNGIKRIFHTWDNWECYKAGFYDEQVPASFTVESAEVFYRDFLSDIPLFESCLSRVISEWKNSCEHYLTNENMNRIAWLGQASVCIHSGLPSKFRGGYNLLSEEQKMKADLMAFKYLNIWLVSNGYPELKEFNQASSKTEANLY